MVKLLHTADLHLDSPLGTLALRDGALRAEIENATRAALARIVDIALAEEVGALLIAGDLYDGGQRSMRTAAFLISQFRRLADAGIRVFVIRGNHDAESRITAEIGWPDNVHVFSGRGEAVPLAGTDIVIQGVSFRDPHAPQSLVPRYRAQPGKVNIGLLHTSLGGAPGHDPYAPCSVPELVAAGFDYWALGHVHSRQVHHEYPFIVMPGMPQGRDIGEDGPKSATLIHVEDDGLRIEERPTAAVLFTRLTCDVSGLGDMADVHAAVRRALGQTAGPVPQVIRLTLTGETGLAWTIRRDCDVIEEAARNEAASLGGLWIDRVEIGVAPPGDQPQVAGAGDEIARLIAELADHLGLRDDALAILDDVVQSLPGELRDSFGVAEQDREQTVDRLLVEATEWAVARMQSAGAGER